MPKFRVTGTDRESGLETRIVIDARSENDAANEAIVRGVTVYGIECVDERRSPLVTIHGNRLWVQVAAGVCAGLIGFTLFIIYVLPAAISASSPRSPAGTLRSPSAPVVRSEWLKLVDKGFLVKDRNRPTWFISWKIDVENTSSAPRVMRSIRIKLVDAEGFQMASDSEYDFVFQPGMNTLTGVVMIDAINGARITDVLVFTSE